MRLLLVLASQMSLLSALMAVAMLGTSALAKQIDCMMHGLLYARRLMFTACPYATYN